MTTMNSIKYRHELKHYINIGDYLVLRNRIRSIMKRDHNCGSDGQYKIRSLYFDDPFDRALFEKLYGVNHRSKFRIRYYNDDPGFIRLEKKIKEKSLTAKLSAPLTSSQVEAIIGGDIQWLRDSDVPLFNELFIKMQSGLLKPKTIVEYIREAYIYGPGRVRVTFDKSIKSGLFSTDFFNANLPTVDVIRKELVILEVKYDEYLPEVIRDIIQTNQRRATSVSKYALCRMYG